MLDKQDINIYPLINKVDSGSIKDIKQKELLALAEELRAKTIEVVAKTGGHLGAGLGVIELTIALHWVFDTPKDQLIWDIGHQTYPHKILTGRLKDIETIRVAGGLSGFTKRAESIYDPWGAGHSSTSISAALGMAIARDLNKQSHEVIAVIGDGSISAGMAYEAMNNAAANNKRLIVILNDNDMSIAKPVGAMSRYLSKLVSSSKYLSIRNKAKQVFENLPSLENLAKSAEKYAKSVATGGNLFEDLGFYYIGPVDGHNIDDLVTIFKNIKQDATIQKPILIHIITEKGRGFEAKEQCVEKFHAIGKFDPATKIQHKSSSINKTYTNIFSKILLNEADKDETIVAITAAMPSGTGLSEFAKKFPNRFFDVGIAEQHAVTFAAGLACSNIKPVVAIYSTFLQRAYDQIIHDVAIQNLPVRFAIDRAGYVGADGPTHAGSFDIAFLSIIPNMIIMAASDELTLAAMIKTSLSINYAPSAFRYPRGEAIGVDYSKAEILHIGKARIIQEGEKLAILSLGSRLNEVKDAAKLIKDIYGFNITIIDMLFAKPIDYDIVSTIAQSHDIIISIEEGSIGGFGSQILEYLTHNDLMKDKKFRSLHFPDEFTEQNTQDYMNSQAGLNSNNIFKLITSLINIVEIS